MFGVGEGPIGIFLSVIEDLSPRDLRPEATHQLGVVAIHRDRLDSQWHLVLLVVGLACRVTGKEVTLVT